MSSSNHLRLLEESAELTLKVASHDEIQLETLRVIRSERLGS